MRNPLLLFAYYLRFIFWIELVNLYWGSATTSLGRLLLIRMDQQSKSLAQPYTAQVQIKSWRERSYLDQLTDLFVRPPRQLYDPKSLGTFFKISPLGPSTFFFQKLLIFREDFVVLSKRNLKLQCSLYSPVRYKDSERPCVIYLHGNSSSRLESQAYAGMICEEGMSLLTFDFGGCGNSEGDVVSLGWYEKDDLLSVLEHLRNTNPKLKRFGLWGRSMGAVTAIMAAAQHPDLTKAIVADSPFTSLKQLCLDIGEKQYSLPNVVVRKRILRQANYDPKRLNTALYLRKIPHCSVFFLRAYDDRMIYQSHVDTLFQCCKGEKYITIFQGDHNSNRPTEIYQNIVKFFVNRLHPERKEQPPIAPKQSKLTINTQANSKPDSSERTNEQLVSHEVAQFEIALEYAVNEKINDTNRDKRVRNDDLSSNSVSYIDEQILPNNPFHCDYMVGKDQLGQKKQLMKGEQFSIDSECCIRVAQEQGCDEMAQFDHFSS